MQNLVESVNFVTSGVEIYEQFLASPQDLSLQDLTEIIEWAEQSQKILFELKVESLFKEEACSCNVILEINAGAGGTDSQDWAAMLEDMYIKWSQNTGYKVECLDRLQGEEAGIKSTTLLISKTPSIKGLYSYPYGLIRNETGVHRLVRISPFNANDKRQTSFASVLISPHIDNKIEIKIDDKDIKLDTFRSSGAGGQHVNTTDSAVRITHKPSGIVVTCQNQRSQHQNKATAMDILKSKLYALEQQKQEAIKSGTQKANISFGSQIRNYVLHPYKLVKDLRSDYQTSNTEAVLAGRIDEILMSLL